MTSDTKELEEALKSFEIEHWEQRVQILHKFARSHLSLLKRVEAGELRQWTFYECMNCKTMYLNEPVSVCECHHDSTSFKKRFMIDKDHLIQDAPDEGGK